MKYIKAILTGDGICVEISETRVVKDEKELYELAKAEGCHCIMYGGKPSKEGIDKWLFYSSD